MNATADAQKNELGGPKQSGHRLSEHYHKVRLTSLLLSTALLFYCLHGNLYATTSIDVFAMGKISIRPDEAPFVVGALALGCAVAFSHLLTLWRIEARELDAQSAEARSFQDRFEKLTLDTEILQVDVSNTIDRTQFISTYFLENGRFPTHHDTKWNDDFEEVLRESFNLYLSSLADDFENIAGGHKDGVMAAPVPESLPPMTDGVLTELDNEIGIEPMQKLREYVISARKWERANAVLTIDQILKSINSHLQHQENEISNFIAFKDGGFKSIVQSLLTSDANCYHMIAEAESLAKSSLLTLANRADDLAHSLRAAMRALRQASRMTQIQIRGYDLIVPSVVFVIAECHAHGMLFGGFIPSAPYWFDQVRKFVLKFGVGASIWLFVLFAIVILVSAGFWTSDDFKSVRRKA